MLGRVLLYSRASAIGLVIYLIAVISVVFTQPCLIGVSTLMAMAIILFSLSANNEIRMSVIHIE
jgi:hypothetical protein